MNNPVARVDTAGLEGSAVTLPTMTASPFSPLLAGRESKVEHVEIRRSEPSDAEHIQKLLNPQAQSYFGPRCDVLRVLEHANLSLSLSFPHGGLCAHASFFDYPSNISRRDSANWEDWLITACPELRGKATPFNSLFLGLFLYQDVIKSEALRECLKTAFDLVPSIQYVFFLLPKGKHLISLYTPFFTRIDRIHIAADSEDTETIETIEIPDAETVSDNPVESGEDEVISTESLNSQTEADEQKSETAEEVTEVTEVLEAPEEEIEEVRSQFNLDIYLSERHRLLPTLHVREAQEEDTDDLSPLFLRHTEHLHDTYGDYFIAELVTGGPVKSSLVAEVDGRAVGFMGISSSISVEVLEDNFRLEPYHGLRKPSPDDEVKEFELLSETGSESSFVGNKKGSISQESKQSIAKSLASQLGQSRELNKLSERESAVSIDSGSESGAYEDSTVADQATKASVSFAADGASCVSSPSQSTIRTQEPSNRSRKSSALIQPVVDNIEKAKAKERLGVFKGKPSALSVQLFCLDEKFESRALDFLPSIFKLWPAHDYCVLTQPHFVPEHPLLQQGFSRVHPRSGLAFDHELYVLHKGSILDSISVSLASEADSEGVKLLVSGLSVANRVLEDLSRFLAHNCDPVTQGAAPLYFFIAKCLTQIVGAVVIRTEKDIEYIRARFNIEEFIYYNYHKQHEHARLHFCIVNPVFQRHVKFVLKEVLRQSHKTCLYYPLYPLYSVTNNDSHSALSAINAMIPVRPRRQIIYPADNLGENSPSVNITADQDPCVLYHFNRKLTLEPKIAVNHRIVVVGSSDVSLSFLQFLLYNASHLTFHNITLVSKNGLSSHRDQQLTSNQCIQPYELVDTCIGSAVNVVVGEIVKIDREKKILTTCSHVSIPYDNLILCCGEQYQLPPQCDVTNPVVTCNDTQDLKQLEIILGGLVDTDSFIVVYGNTIESYAILNLILENGILPGRVKFVVPPHKYRGNAFNNKFIQKRMDEICSEMGVQVMNGVLKEFVCVDTDANSWNVIIETGLGEEKEVLSLGYALFVCLSEKDVNMCAFKAMNDSCLVYDGRLVIDRAFHTNDPSIFAAGPLTKFSRRYYSDPWRLKCFNSREVGEKLAIEVLKNFDPLQAEPTETQDQNLIPAFTKPKIFNCMLPGSTYYLDVYKPVPDELKTEEKSRYNPQRELVTATEDSGYFRVVIDEYGYITQVTCLANKSFEVENIMALYGIYEKLLNNMHSRFKNHKITDFFKFFRESSLLAIFHDRFEDFKQELQLILATQTLNDDTEDTFQDKVHQVLAKDWKMTDLHMKELQHLYEDSQTREIIRKHLMNYLNYNFYHLPMYAKGNHGMDSSLAL